MNKPLRQLLFVVVGLYLLQLVAIWPRSINSEPISTADGRHSVMLELRKGAYDWDALVPGFGLLFYFSGRALYLKTQESRYMLDYGDSYDSFSVHDLSLVVEGGDAELRGQYEWIGSAEECRVK